MTTTPPPRLDQRGGASPPHARPVAEPRDSKEEPTMTTATTKAPDLAALARAVDWTRSTTARFCVVCYHAETGALITVCEYATTQASAEKKRDTWNTLPRLPLHSIAIVPKPTR